MPDPRPGRGSVPKYDYRCSAGHLYEKREGFDAPSVQTCQVCGVEARRVLTPPAIVFKGSGWYATDSRKSSPSESASTPAASTDATPTAATETKAEAKTDKDTKTETKTATKSESTSLAAD
jgi:putative FmdB family regulatory protein